MSDRAQYKRFCKLIVEGGGAGLDLGALRVVFKIKKSDAQTPNNAEMRVYNIAPETAKKIRDEFKTVTLQAGYENNFGVIFKGNIKQMRLGRENGTDTYLDIAAGDGDAAYNYAVVNTTLAAGSKQSDQIGVANNAMASKGVVAGFITNTADQALARGKVMYGMARDYLRQSAKSSGADWSIQDGKVQVVSKTATLPGKAVLLNSKTGLIGTPEQTNEGLTVKCLINPLLKIGGRVKIDQAAVSSARLPDTGKKDVVNNPADTVNDGLYRLLVVEHQGDTRGGDWYSTLTCLKADSSAPSGKEVKPA